MRVVDVNPEGFSVKSGLLSKKVFEWSQVNQVQAVKIDKVTYEECFLVVGMSAGEVVEVGELDEQFAPFSSALGERIGGIDANWRAALEAKAAGSYIVLWQR